MFTFLLTLNKYINKTGKSFTNEYVPRYCSINFIHRERG